VQKIQTLSHPLKAGQYFIFLSMKNTVDPASRNQELRNTMHEQGMQQHDMLMTEMWEKLSDDQKMTMMKRMLDAKIMMKEEMIKHFQFKIETMKMMKKMLDMC
jgi:hypothetical protein